MLVEGLRTEAHAAFRQRLVVVTMCSSNVVLDSNHPNYDDEDLYPCWLLLQPFSFGY